LDVRIGVLSGSVLDDAIGTSLGVGRHLAAEARRRLVAEEAAKASDASVAECWRRFRDD
jgi:hypothetical protein